MVLMSVAETLVIRQAQEQLLRLEAEGAVHTFDLAQTIRVSLGRHPSNDVQVRSRRVSSYHAEIRKEVDGLFVHDMNSTNGTFVNEESVTRRKLEPGDRITLGGFTLTVKLVPRDEPVSGAADEPARAPRYDVGTTGALLPFREPGDASDSDLGRGRDDTTLPELLKVLGRESASATVAVSVTDVSGESQGLVRVIAGGVVDCELGRARKEKALYRLLALAGAAYEIRPLPETEVVSEAIEASTDALLAEGLQQVEALDKLAAKLPRSTSEIRLNDQCAIAINTLTADEAEIYELLIRHRTLGRVLEESPMTDFMVMMVVHGLLHRGFFRAPVTVEP
jgi:pSer/pThr/pTyr-binding forkhead associated (FHA) protein